MLRKLTVLLIATFFSLSVAGLSFAQEKPKDKPTEKPVEKSAPDNPCLGKPTTKKKATKKKTIKKKTTKKKMGEVPGPVEK